MTPRRHLNTFLFKKRQVVTAIEAYCVLSTNNRSCLKSTGPIEYEYDIFTNNNAFKIGIKEII